ncbi:putative mei2/Mei2-like RNA recognition, RNA-binding domain superfamily [Helianthus anomalus]
MSHALPPSNRFMNFALDPKIFDDQYSMSICEGFFRSAGTLLRCCWLQLMNAIVEQINKCNMGYAFINMTEPPLIIPFYQAFNGKKWEKFNSEKVASLAYARIQGKAAFIAHFQNSS